MCKLLIYPFSLVLLFLSTCCCINGEKREIDPLDITRSSTPTEFSFLSLNVWIECTKVPNGPEFLIEQIAFLAPDVATFCEFYKGEGDDPLLPKLIEGLKNKGVTYYAAQIEGRVIISKYPISETKKINQWMCKAILFVNGQRIAVYSAHSEYRYYSCYYPRGYNDGSVNWNKLPAPITDVDKILAVNRQSDRVRSAQAFINDAEMELEKGALVFLGGDLNEPSHLDWGEDTKDLWGHNGCVVPWDVSLLLYDNGFKDAYREVFSNAVEYPGFTFPADNRDAAVNTLTWAPDADERERIDFIYYYPSEKLKIKEASIFGPSGSIVRSERKQETSKDVFVTPLHDNWPSDHKGVIGIFTIE